MAAVCSCSRAGQQLPGLCEPAGEGSDPCPFLWHWCQCIWSRVCRAGCKQTVPKWNRPSEGARGWERRAWGEAEAIAQPGGEDSPGGAVQLPEVGPGSAQNAQGKVRRQQARGGLGNTIQTYVRAFPPVNDQQGSWEVSQAALCSAHSTYPCFGQGVGLETHSSPF